MTVVSSRQQADGSRQYLTQMFSFQGFYCLLPSACFSPIELSKGDQNRSLEAKESRLGSTEKRSPLLCGDLSGFVVQVAAEAQPVEIQE